MTRPTADFFITLDDADKRATRSFVRGLIIGGTIVGSLAYALPAWAGDTASWSGTGCTLVPVADQEHVAEVRCVNLLTSGSSYTTADLMVDGLTVGFGITHTPGDEPDRFSFFVITPGFYAEPPTLVLDENSRGTVLIFEWVGS